MKNECNIIKKCFANGKLVLYPSKRHKQLLVLQKLASYFSPKTEYSEKEVNDILKNTSLCQDYATLRRDLIDSNYLERAKNGTKYWVKTKEP